MTTINSTVYHAVRKKETAETIKEEGFDIEKPGDNYFGKGVYFFDNEEDAEIWGEIVLEVDLEYRQGQQFHRGGHERYFEVLQHEIGIDPCLESERVRGWMLDNGYKLGLTTEDFDDQEEMEIAIVFDTSIIKNIK